MIPKRAPSQPEQARGTAADIRAIEVLRNQYATADDSSDAAAAAACYTEDAVAIFPNHPVVDDRQAIRATLEDYFKQNAVKITQAPSEMQVARGWPLSTAKSPKPLPRESTNR